MSAGRTYRVHLVSRQRCVAASLYPPGTDSFEEGSPVRNLDCDDYFLFTPGPGAGGRYSIQVRAPRNRRGALPYRVQVARAGEDDTAPGVVLANDKRVRGSLRGSGADVLDLYRFDVRRPSILDLQLKTGGANPFNLQLVGEGGRRIACACGSTGGQQIRLRLKPGRYFTAVRSRSAADGRYTLSRLTRVITRTRVLVNGRRDADLRPGQTAAIGVRITPGESGPVTVDVERFDPLSGWQFYKRFSGGRSAGRRRSRSSPRPSGAGACGRPTTGRARPPRAGRPGRRSPSPSRSDAVTDGPVADRGISSRGPWPSHARARRLPGMPHPTRSGLGEVAITTTLLSIYLSARGTNRALGVVQAAPGALARAARAPGRAAARALTGARRAGKIGRPCPPQRPRGITVLPHGPGGVTRCRPRHVGGSPDLRGGHRRQPTRV